MAGAVKLPLSVILAAVDKFSAPLGKIATKLDGFAAKAGKIGKAMSVGVTAPTVAFLGLAVKTGAELDRAMGQVSAATGLAREELTEVRKLSEKLGETPPFSAAAVAGAAAMLAKEGKSAVEIVSLLPNVANLAAAGGIELAQSVEIVTDSLDAFNLDASKSIGVVDRLAAAGSKAGGLQNLVATLDAVAPGAAASAQGFEDTLTAIVALNAAGAEGGKAAAAYNAALSRLAEGSSATRDKLAELGLGQSDVLTDAGKLRPLVDILGTIADRGATAGDFIDLFGAKAGPALAAASAKGSAGLRSMREELDQTGGEAARRAALATGGAGFAFERLASSVEKLQLAIASSGLLEWVANVVDKFAGWISVVAETNPGLLQFVTIVAAAAATIGPVVLILGQLAGAVSSMVGLWKLFTAAQWAANIAMNANPIGLVVLGVAALIGVIYLLWKHWDKVFGFLRATWELFTLPVRTFIGWILDAFPAIDALIPDWIRGIIKGKTFQTPGSGPAIETGKLAAAASAGAGQKAESRVAVDFENVPRGVSIKEQRGGTAPLDLSVGPAMAGG